MAPSTDGLETRLKAKAADLGLDACGIMAADDAAGLGERLDAFLAAGHHGTMDWLAGRARHRRAPQALWPEARSVVAVAMNYGPARDPLEDLDRRDRGLVSVYASGEDYHDVVKKRLKALGRWFAIESGADVKVFVDTAPVMEKPLAERAGIGWQGKHTNLVSRDFGSWLFLGAMYTTARLVPDRPEIDHCGSCRACLDICPTDAFPAPYRLDARRCISYLTIEHKGHIPDEFRAAIGNRIYGCDDCLAVCPWNKFARVASEAKFHARTEIDRRPLSELAALDDTAFRAMFRKSPVKRTGRDRFVRNVMIGIGNSGDPALAGVAVARLDDPSPLVRAMAVWALRRLADPATLARHARRHAGEEDPAVRAEWRKAA